MIIKLGIFPGDLKPVSSNDNYVRFWDAAKDNIRQDRASQLYCIVTPNTPLCVFRDILILIGI